MLEVEYRSLIANYGLAGSIGIPYVYFKLSGDIQDIPVERLDAFLEYGKSLQCDQTAPMQRIEHALTALQNQLYTPDRQLPCIHHQLRSGALKQPATGTFLFNHYHHRKVVSDFLDLILEYLNDGRGLVNPELLDDLHDRIEDPEIYRLQQLLTEKGIPTYDTEDDSRLLALGEGEAAIIIQRRLEHGQLRWINKPFPILDVDEIELLEQSPWHLLQLPADFLKDGDDGWLRVNFPPWDKLVKTGSIPKHLVTGTNGKTTTTRMLAHVLRESRGYRIGMTSTHGIYVDGKPPVYGDFTGPWSARNVLLEDVEEVVLETARGGLIREGVIFDRVETAIITNVAADHLGLRDINTVEEMAILKGLVLSAAKQAVVLNAMNPLVRKFKDKIAADQITHQLNVEVWGFADNEADLDGFTNAVFVRDSVITIQTTGDQVECCHVDELPVTLGGALTYMIHNALAVIAASYANGIDPTMIKKALSSFTASEGRGELIQQAGRRIILDYGHNPHALEQIDATLRALIHRHHPSHVILLALTAGDRSDDHLRRMAGIYAAMPINHIVYKDMWLDLRGREVGEVGKIMEEEMQRLGFKGAIHQVPDSVEAIKVALKLSQANDLVFLCAERAKEMRQIVTTFKFN